MNIWEILNSPFIVTVISFALGGVVVALVSAKLQQRGQRHSVRLVLTREILATYHEYVRFLRRARNPEDEGDDDEFDRLHAELMSRTRITKVLFSYNMHQDLTRLASRLANIQQLRRDGAQEQAKAKLIDVYQHAESIFEAMFSELN